MAARLLNKVSARLRSIGESLGKSPRPPLMRPTLTRPPSRRRRSSPWTDYPGDYESAPTMTYDAQPDGIPQSGEIVWTWVPYEEDHSQGKDRPVLLIGSDGRYLLGLALTSKDHDWDAAQEAAAGREWVDIGSGPWDRRRRDSEVRVNRIIRVNPDRIRREGSALDPALFEQVAEAVRRSYPARRDSNSN